MLKIKVEGYQEAKDILDELPNKMQKQMLRSALKKSSKPFVKGAQSRVPVKSGQLKKQLKVVSYRDRQVPKTEVDVAVKHVFSRSKKKKAVNEYYGKFVHEGTRDPRWPKKKGGVLVFTLPNGDKVFARHVRGLKPRPYIEEAYKESYQTVGRWLPSQPIAPRKNPLCAPRTASQAMTPSLRWRSTITGWPGPSCSSERCEEPSRALWWTERCAATGAHLRIITRTTIYTVGH